MAGFSLETTSTLSATLSVLFVVGAAATAGVFVSFDFGDDFSATAGFLANKADHRGALGLGGSTGAAFVSAVWSLEVCE